MEKKKRKRPTPAERRAKYRSTGNRPGAPVTVGVFDHCSIWVTAEHVQLLASINPTNRSAAARTILDRYRAELPAITIESDRLPAPGPGQPAGRPAVAHGDRYIRIGLTEDQYIALDRLYPNNRSAAMRAILTHYKLYRP